MPKKKHLLSHRLTHGETSSEERVETLDFDSIRRAFLREMLAERSCPRTD